MTDYDLKDRFKSHKVGILETLTRCTDAPLTWLILKTPLTPNMVTVMSLVTALTACFLFQLGEYRYVGLGGVVFYFSVVLDVVDGDIARLKKMGSVWGAWFDEMTDTVKMSLGVFTLGLGIWRMTGSDTILIAGSIGAMNILFFNYCRQHVLYRLTAGTKFEKEPEVTVSKNFFIGFTFPTFYALSFLPLFGLAPVVVWTYATVGVLPWIIKLRSAYKKKNLI